MIRAVIAAAFLAAVAFSAHAAPTDNGSSGGTSHFTCGRQGTTGACTCTGVSDCNLMGQSGVCAPNTTTCKESNCSCTMKSAVSTGPGRQLPTVTPGSATAGAKAK